MHNVSTLPTVGEIARRTGYPIHRVEYAIRTRGIAPAGRAGNTRVFREDDVQRIADELRHMDEVREVRHG